MAKLLFAALLACLLASACSEKAEGPPPPGRAAAPAPGAPPPAAGPPVAAGQKPGAGAPPPQAPPPPEGEVKITVAPPRPPGLAPEERARLEKERGEIESSMQDVIKQYEANLGKPEKMRELESRLRAESAAYKEKALALVKDKLKEENAKK